MGMIDRLAKDHPKSEITLYEDSDDESGHDGVFLPIHVHGIDLVFDEAGPIWSAYCPENGCIEMNDKDHPSHGSCVFDVLDWNPNATPELLQTREPRIAVRFNIGAAQFDAAGEDFVYPLVVYLDDVVDVRELDEFEPGQVI